MTDAVLSGAFGNGYDPNLLWGNPILGNILVFLYQLIPTVSFYFVLLFVLGFTSLTAITYILFKKGVNYLTVAIAVLFLLFFVDDVYVLVQFTKIASVSGVAGGLLVLYGMGESALNRIKCIVSGVILALLGSMIRFECIYLYSVFLLISFLFYALNKRDNQSNKADTININKVWILKIAQRFMICVLLVLGLFAINRVGVWLSNLDAEYRSYNDFHDIRYRITDVAYPEYDSISNEYSELGMDALDWMMIRTWNFPDRSVYSDDTLRRVGEINKSVSDSYTHSLPWIVEKFFDHQPMLYWSSIGVYVLASLLFFLNKNRYFSFFVYLVSFVFQIAFIYMGRCVYRVEWSVFFCAAATMITSIDLKTEFDFKAKNNKQSKIVFKTVISTLLIVLIVYRALVLMPKSSYLEMSEEDYMECFDSIMLDNAEFYYTDKYMFPTLDRPPYRSLINRMHSDSDHYYYVDFYTGCMSLYLSYEPWIRPEQGMFCNDYAFYGGVTMHHPGEHYALSVNGIDPDNPFSGLVYDNVYLIDNSGYGNKLQYIRRYYNPDAEIELIDIVDGMYIWNIYIP